MAFTTAMHYQTYIVARCRKHRKVLKGGLGVTGVGFMWFDENGTEANDPRFVGQWDEAPEECETGSSA